MVKTRALLLQNATLSMSDVEREEERGLQAQLHLEEELLVF